MADQIEGIAEQTPPTLFEQAYWDLDDERLGAAYDALVGDTPSVIPGERFEEFVGLVWRTVVENRLRQRELALKMGELIAAQEVAKPARKRARMPRDMLPPEPEDAA
ncbi:MAG TPA: hypothetical protein VF808_06520 [Ktedonobacterales bacterium]